MSEELIKLSQPQELEHQDKDILEAVFKEKGNKLKELKEYESVNIDLEGYSYNKVWEVLSKRLSSFKYLGLNAEIYPASGDKKGICYLVASDKIGVCCLEGNVNYQIRVSPKIAVKDLARMIVWAYFPKLIEIGKEYATPTDLSIHLVIPVLFIEELETLIKNLSYVLRRSYVYHQEELRAKIKGKPNLTLYFSQYKSRFKDHYIPCSWWDLNKDNDYNRALKLGLKICKKFFMNLSSLPEEIKYLNTIKNLEFLFFPITLDKTVKQRVNKLRCVGNFAPYKEAIEIVRLIFDLIDFSIEANDIKLKGFALPMYEVFEQCVINYLQKKMDFKIEEKKSVKYKIKKPEEFTKNFSKNIIPDAIINVDNGKKFVLDTKWKSAFIETSSDEEIIDEYENIKIKNDDIYQVIAYGMHKEIQAEGAFLIYPSERPHNSPPPPIWKITSFQGSKEFPIYILGLPLGGDLEEGLKYLSEEISNKIKETI